MWLYPQQTADLIKFTEEIPNRKLRFLYSNNGNVLLTKITLTDTNFMQPRNKMDISKRNDYWDMFWIVVAFQVLGKFRECIYIFKA